MPYISQLLNNKIYDSSDAAAGRLQDILISPKEASFAPLEFLVIKTKDGQTRFVPYEAVANFDSSNIVLKNLFNKVALTELPPSNGYVYLKKQVLDRQIVDVAGTRVVRVNDLRLNVFDNKMCVVGIDASFRGLLRRLGLTGTILAAPFKVQLIDWRQAKLLEGSGPLQLNTAAAQLGRLHPADLANIVEDLDVKYGSSLLASLDSVDAAKVLEEVDPALQTILVKYLGPERAGKIISHMSSDELVDLVKTFSAPEAAKYLSQMSARAEQLIKLSAYPDNTAGGLMTPDYVAVSPDWTVVQAEEEIRRLTPNMRSILYVYAVDGQGQLRGVVSLRRLIVAEPHIQIKNLVKTLRYYDTLRANDSVSKIINLMTKYNLYVAAVVDENHKMLGVVTIDDVMRQLFPGA